MIETQIIIDEECTEIIEIGTHGDAVEVVEEVVEVIEVAEQGPSGASGGVLNEDPSPTLGADLLLNGHSIVGSLENNSFVIDGGLL